MTTPASRLTQNTLSSQASDTVHRLKGAVCQIDTNSPGTGFLITPNCLLTCCHVLPEKEVAQKAYVCFSDIQSTISVALNPDPLKNGFYLTSKLEGLGFTAKHLDFALVALSQTVEKVSDLFVLTDQFPPQKEQIHVIQHPVIEVTKRDPDTNRPLEVKQLTGEMRIATGQVTEFDHYIIHHTAPVAGGSSGAPIVNDAGYLYAFHQAECTNPAHKKCTNPEHAKSKNPVHKDCKILVNCGIGVCTAAVFRYLRDHHIVLDDFEQLRQCAALKVKYAKQSYLELIRPVRGYKDWMLKFPIDAIYTELVILRARIKKREEKNRDEPSFRPDQGLESYETLFMDKESISRDKFFSLLKNSKKLLILGAAGTGKTTFCQHIAFQWSRGNILTEYQALFWIRLRNLKKADTLEILFQREFGFILSGKHFRFALLILDGFDELPPYAEALFRELTAQFLHVIVTSRPKICIPFPSTVQLEIIGLDTINSNIYIEHYFNTLHDQHPEEISKEGVLPKACRLRQLLITHPLLASLAHIPVNLSLLCAIFSQEEDFLKDQQSITVTALYNYIVNWLYTYFQIRQKELLNPTNDSMSDLVSQSNPLSDSVVRNLDHTLSEIALDYTQNNTLYTSQTELENFLIDQSCSLKVNQLNDSGLFKIEHSEGEFIHLSYQDFFVARHLASLYAAKRHEEAQAFIKAYKLRERYKWIFWMAAGLLSIRNPRLLPQYFEDLHTLARDLGKSYELRLLALCYEECLHTDALPRYSEFLNNVINYLKEHPHLSSKAELFINCPKLLTESAIIQCLCDFSFVEFTRLIDQIGHRQQYIPDVILETICNKFTNEFTQIPEKHNDLQNLYIIHVLIILKNAAIYNKKLTMTCLEFVRLFLKNTLDYPGNWGYDNQAFDIFLLVFKQQKINLSSLEARLEWLKKLALPPQTYFCLLIEGLKEYDRDPKAQATFITSYFLQHPREELLSLGGLSPLEMFDKLLSIDSNSNYLLRVNYCIFDLISYLLLLESVNSALSATHLVDLSLTGNLVAAYALKELLRLGYSINNEDLIKIIEKCKKEVSQAAEAETSELKEFLIIILIEVVINDHVFSDDILALLGNYRCIEALVCIAKAQKKYSEAAFQLILRDLRSYINFYNERWNLVHLLKASYIERIAQAVLTIFYERQTLDSVTKILSDLVSAGHFFSLEEIDHFIQFLRGVEQTGAKNVIAYILCDMIKMGHPHLHTILKKIEAELVDDIHHDLKMNFARVMIGAQEIEWELSLSVIEALVSCIPNAKLKMQTSSLCIIEITKLDYLHEIDSILTLILKRTSIKLSHNTLINLLKFKDIGVFKDNIINVLSLLNYHDYNQEPWGRELFIQIAYLTGQPFIEAEQG